LQFCSQIPKNTNKKSSLLFSDRLRFTQIKQIFYSKLPLACRILSRRPPPTISVFAINLPHNTNIKPISSYFVKLD